MLRCLPGRQAVRLLGQSKWVDLNELDGKPDESGLARRMLPASVAPDCSGERHLSTEHQRRVSPAIRLPSRDAYACRYSWAEPVGARSHEGRASRVTLKF